MSDYQSKIALRLHLGVPVGDYDTWLDSKCKEFISVLYKLGYNEEDFDIFHDGEDENLISHVETFVPYEMSRGNFEDSGFYVDYIIKNRKQLEFESVLKMEDLIKLCKEFAVAFGRSWIEVRVVGVCWYDGVDEPGLY